MKIIEIDQIMKQVGKIPGDKIVTLIGGDVPPLQILVSCSGQWGSNRAESTKAMARINLIANWYTGKMLVSRTPENQAICSWDLGGNKAEFCTDGIGGASCD